MQISILTHSLPNNLPNPPLLNSTLPLIIDDYPIQILLRLLHKKQFLDKRLLLHAKPPAPLPLPPLTTPRLLPLTSLINLAKRPSNIPGGCWCLRRVNRVGLEISFGGVEGRGVIWMVRGDGMGVGSLQVARS